MQNKIRIRKRVDTIKVKAKLNDAKKEGVVRFFSVNCDGLGPHSVVKIKQLKFMSKIRK